MVIFHWLFNKLCVRLTTGSGSAEMKEGVAAVVEGKIKLLWFLVWW